VADPTTDALVAKAEPSVQRCPGCGRRAIRTRTRYGLRDDCPDCDMHGWDGKPLVSREVHAARVHCHEVVDALWMKAETAYEIAEAPGTKGYERAVKRIRKTARVRVYEYLSVTLEIPEPLCHMSVQTDIPTLRRIYAAAKATTPAEIRAWAKARRETIMAMQTPAGGWTKDDLAKLGVPWPPPKGWLRQMTGGAD
jgi:hypothetical protein